MAKYTSGRQKNLKIGISSYSENLTSLEVIGNVGIGTTNATSKLTVSGNVNVIGVVTATSFSGSGAGLTNIPAGQLTGALPAIDGSALTGIVASGSGVVIGDDGSLVGTAGTIDFGANLSVSFASGIATITASGAGIVTFVDNAGIATNIKGGVIGNIPYQSAADTTAFLTNGSSGTILQSNGVGNAPTWVTAAPAGAVSGLVIRDSNNNIVGTSGSVSQLTFSTGLSVTGTTGTAGIATITLSSNLVGSALSISGISTLGVTSTTNLTSQQLNVSGIATASTFRVGTAVTVNSSGINVTGIVTASSFVGSGANLTGIANTANIVSTAITTGTLNVTTSAVIGSGVTINSSGINVTGVITASSFSGNASSATYATSAGIATYATSAGIATYATTSGVSTSVIGGISSVTQLSVSGISTVGFITATNSYTSGISSVGTAITMYGSTGIVSATKYYGDGSSLSGMSTSIIVNGTSNITVASGSTISATVSGQNIFNVTGIGVSMVAGERLDVSSYSENVNFLGSVSGTTALDVGTYSVFVADISGSTAVTFTLSGAVSGRLSSVTLILRFSGSASRSVSLAFNPKYVCGSGPTYSTTAVTDIISFFTADAGTTTYVSVVGQGFA